MGCSAALQFAFGEKPPNLCLHRRNHPVSCLAGINVALRRLRRMKAGLGALSVVFLPDVARFVSLSFLDTPPPPPWQMQCKPTPASVAQGTASWTCRGPQPSAYRPAPPSPPAPTRPSLPPPHRQRQRRQARCSWRLLRMVRKLRRCDRGVCVSSGRIVMQAGLRISQSQPRQAKPGLPLGAHACCWKANSHESTIL